MNYQWLTLALIPVLSGPLCFAADSELLSLVGLKRTADMGTGAGPSGGPVRQGAPGLGEMALRPWTNNGSAILSNKLANRTPEAQVTTRIALKEKYRYVEVERFDAAEGVEFPAEYVQSLQDEIVKELRKSGEFKEVLLGGQNPAEADTSVLRLSGTVIYFNPGNRAGRYFGGVVGAGAGHIAARVGFEDRSTGESLVTDQPNATLSGGILGGGAKSITNELARVLANDSKLFLEKPVPSFGDLAPRETTGAALPSAERKTVTLSGGNFEQWQADLNAEASAGYRIVAFTPKGGKNADVTMERTATPPQVYQYRVLHAVLLGNVQKNLDRAALDGYHYCRYTFVWADSILAIMEKPPIPPGTSYDYRVHAPRQMSNARKDVVNDQAQNFSLVGTFEIQGGHFVLTERAVSKGAE